MKFLLFIAQKLNLVKENTIDLISIVEKIPFYSQIVGSEKDTIFDSRVYVKLHQYFFMCTLNLYISLFNEMKDNSVLGSIAEQKEMADKSIEDTIIKGFQDNLEKTLAMYNTCISRIENEINRGATQEDVSQNRALTEDLDGKFYTEGAFISPEKWRRTIYLSLTSEKN